MVAAEFIDFLQKLHIPDYIGVEDFADKLSFLYSVLVLLLCTSIVTVKQYLMSAIACYIPTEPTGSNFDGFLENYCWVHGTIPILKGEPIPQKLDEWAEFDRKHRINYYQWVPFMLGIQCVLFYLPRMIWQIICSHQTGTDLGNLVVVASQASNASEEERKKLVQHVTSSITGMLDQNRGLTDGVQRHKTDRWYSSCRLLIMSKRLGTWLAFTYLLIKMCYLTNSIGQLYLMQRFLGFNDSLSNFGMDLSQYMLSGQNWEQTRIFPRISFCYMADLRQLGTTNRYIAQCVLPVNMLNEKMYIFLWFWIATVAICTALSIPLWLIRLGLTKNRLHFIKKFLRITDQFTKSDKTKLKRFTNDFLRHDGVFLLRMISMNAGDVITSEVVSKLWTTYSEAEKPALSLPTPSSSNTGPKDTTITSNMKPDTEKHLSSTSARLEKV
ncbi:unnamed protein product [Calicophoron daubneyi]|uniref:Innexin n=1 Tax=Calicophoron daubneyi TaxID=300641 RepID=A0AAV2TXG4_CALDB